MLQKMRRIQVIGPKQSFHEAVDVLYRTGTVHLEDVSQCISPDEICLKKVEMEGLGDVPGILVKINGIFFTLSPTADEQGLQARFEQELNAGQHAQVIERARQVIADLEWTTKDLALRKSDHEMAIIALNRYEKVIRRIQHIEPELPTLAGYEVNILIIQKEFLEVLKLIQTELAEITGNKFEFMYTGVDEESLAAIAVFNQKYSEQVHAFVFSTNVNEVRLPPDFYGHSFQEMLGMIEERRAVASKEIVEINRDLEKLSGRLVLGAVRAQAVSRGHQRGDEHLRQVRGVGIHVRDPGLGTPEVCPEDDRSTKGGVRRPRRHRDATGDA